MTAMAVTCFILSVLLIAMACVKTSRVREWRASVNPSAPDIPDAGFFLLRLTLLALAAVGIYLGFSMLSLADGDSWSDAELTSAVKGATEELDGSTELGDITDDDTRPADFEGEIATKIRDEIVEHSGGDAPQTGVGVSLYTSSTTDATYDISASGADKTFCMHVTRTHTDDAKVYGVMFPEYTYAVSTEEGQC
ncbi:hypothetical protein [Streptomyces thermodiastaticus]|uniref:hypothetical protein n=1 Tax=Streptomyces thermodiastaticus TaxID=44061 RepID=UPI001676F62D|nr:hypothetical protein [Streptomyces thermodiastaticus]MCE7553195.1 hypothetical protein [Streptomyces thermodiastaticus]GHF92177.1 hypothetical protein GCM10018787_46220 [Streptomyces thermodiastaticus]